MSRTTTRPARACSSIRDSVSDWGTDWPPGCLPTSRITAPGAAPVGLGWTGDPVFVVPGSMLGVPAITLPVLHDGGLPLGLQLMGFADLDAMLFSAAGGVLAVLR